MAMMRVGFCSDELAECLTVILLVNEPFEALVYCSEFEIVD